MLELIKHKEDHAYKSLKYKSSLPVEKKLLEVNQLVLPLNIIVILHLKEL